MTKTDVAELEQLAMYLAVGVVVGFGFLVYWMIEEQRKGNLTEDSASNYIAGCLGVAVVWPFALLIAAICWGGTFMCWITKKLVKVRND